MLWIVIVFARREHRLSCLFAIGALCLTLAVPIVITGCQERQRNMSSIHLTQADQGKTISAQIGAQVTISLSENPTTGYRWAVDKVDAQYIELKSSDYVLPSSTGVGGGGTRHLTFALKKNGTAQLKLKLWRDWEGDASVTERFALNFVIRVQE